MYHTFKNDNENGKKTENLNFLSKSFKNIFDAQN